MSNHFPYSFRGAPFPGMGGYAYRQRVERLLPTVRGEMSADQPFPRYPKKVRVYDAGDKVADRYTAVFWGDYTASTGEFVYLAMSANPFHPQGFGQHGFSQHLIDRPNGDHLGQKISFFDLALDCQNFVLNRYIHLWGLSGFGMGSKGMIKDSDLIHYVATMADGLYVPCSSSSVQVEWVHDRLVNCPICATKMHNIIKQGWKTEEGDTILLTI